MELINIDIKEKELQKLCQEFSVKKLYLFGSAITDKFNNHSDLDFLVEFHRNGFKGAFDQFSNFKAQLELLYNRKIDLLSATKFRNPIFKNELDRSKKLIYAA